MYVCVCVIQICDSLFDLELHTFCYRKLRMMVQKRIRDI